MVRSNHGSTSESGNQAAACVPEVQIPDEPTSRRSTRASRGKHPNIHRIPRSTVSTQNSSTTVELPNDTSYKQAVLELTTTLMREAGALLQAKTWTD